MRVSPPQCPILFILCSFVDELFEEPLSAHAPPCCSKTAPDAQRVTRRNITRISTQPQPPCPFPRILVLAKCLKPNVCPCRTRRTSSQHGQNHPRRQFRPQADRGV